MKSKPLRSVDAARAAAVVALASAGLLAGAAESRAQTVFREIRIDMSAIPGGAFETREQLRACLSRTLPQAFAGRVSPGSRGAPVLVVRPMTVWLAPASATEVRDEFARGAGTTSLDALEGEGVVGDRRVPVTVSGNPDFGAQGLPAENARLRTETLCQNFALWLSRRV